MPTAKGQTAFLKSITQSATAVPRGPLNSISIVSDKSLGLQKASSLLGYQNYLSKARAWKASQKFSTPGFEAEVQTQASRALDDSRQLAAATLRVASQMKHSGELDRTLTSWLAALKGSGPVQVQDLWNGLVKDDSTRQMLRKHGLSDDLFRPVADAMAKLQGRVLTRDGKLAAEVQFGGSNQVVKAIFRPSPTGAPQTLDDLLSADQFERQLAQFNGYGATSIATIPSSLDNLELSDLALAGAAMSVQVLAQHVRNLQDVGVSTSAGSGPIAAWVLVALVVTLIGYGMAAATCPDGPDHSTGECVVGVIMTIIGGLALVALLGLWEYALIQSGNTLGAVTLFALIISVGDEIATH